VLGNQLQRALVGITRAEDRGLKHARFVVLRNSAMPAALVECGFLSNAQEAQKLATPSYRETVALGIAQGILNYFALVNRAKVELGAPLQPAAGADGRAARAGPAPPPGARCRWRRAPMATSIVAAAPARLRGRPPAGRAGAHGAPLAAPVPVPAEAPAAPAPIPVPVAPAPAPASPAPPPRRGPPGHRPAAHETAESQSGHPDALAGRPVPRTKEPNA
jgi:hypothetical protein